MFTFLPEKIKKQDKLDKTTVLMMLDISDDQGQYSLRRETKEVSPMIAPALLPNNLIKIVSRLRHRERHPDGAQWTPQVETTKR